MQTEEQVKKAFHPIPVVIDRKIGIACHITETDVGGKHHVTVVVNPKEVKDEKHLQKLAQWAKTGEFDYSEVSIAHNLPDSVPVTPAEKREAAKIEASKTTVKGDRPPCECGCGGYPKGKHARFLPGHDSRMHRR